MLHVCVVYFVPGSHLSWEVTAGHNSNYLTYTL